MRFANAGHGAALSVGAFPGGVGAAPGGVGASRGFPGALVPLGAAVAAAAPPPAPAPRDSALLEHEQMQQQTLAAPMIPAVAYTEAPRILTHLNFFLRAFRMSAELALAAVAGLVGLLSASLTSAMLVARAPRPRAAPSATTRPAAPSTTTTRPAAASATTRPAAQPTDGKPATGSVYAARATYYGPDKAHGRNSGDDIFQFVPSSGYTPDQLRRAGSYYCAMTLKFLKMGWMGKIIRVTGSNGAVRDVVVVDTLPDRVDGKNVQVDLFTQKLFEDLGGSMASGMADIKFFVVGNSPVPVPEDSPYNPKKFGFS